MLAKSVNNYTPRWEEKLGDCLTAYRNGVSAVTGYTPFFLLYGRRSRMPLTRLLPVNIDNYFGNRLDDLAVALRMARQSTRDSRRYNKERLDKHANCQDIRTGDTVVIKAEERLTFTSRLDPQWEVTRVRGPVVWIRQQQTGKNKMLNREKVRLVDPEITWEDINPRSIRDQRRRAAIPPPNLAANRSQAAPSTPPSVPQDDLPAEVLGSTNPPATPTQATADQQTGTDPPLSPRRGSTHERPMEADTPPPQTSILEHPPMDGPAPPTSPTVLGSTVGGDEGSGLQAEPMDLDKQRVRIVCEKGEWKVKQTTTEAEATPPEPESEASAPEPLPNTAPPIRIVRRRRRWAVDHTQRDPVVPRRRSRQFTPSPTEVKRAKCEAIALVSVFAC